MNYRPRTDFPIHVVMKCVLHVSHNECLCHITKHVNNAHICYQQFADDQAARVMSWLPRKLAPQVRCVFSILTDSIQHRTLVGRETKPIDCAVPLLHLDSRKVGPTSL